jgi:hypothetical protein
MGLIRIFFLTLGFFFLAVDGHSALPKKVQQEVEDLDAQIEELEGIKRGYESKAIRHEDQAERLQFEHNTYLEMKRHLELADENWEMAARVQVEIDRLKERRMLLLRKNGDEGRLPPPGGDGLEDL